MLLTLFLLPTTILLAGMGMTAGLVTAFAFTCLWMFETGYKLNT